MAASTNDLITDTRNSARPNSTTASGTRAAGGTSLACTLLTGWPLVSKIHFVTYQIDSNSNPIDGTQLDCSGIVSGNTIGSITVIDGTDGGNSIGDIVEMLPTAAWGQDLSDALTSTHNRSGDLKSGITLTLPTIADHTNATHTHATNAQGGSLAANTVDSSQLVADAVTDAKLIYGKVRSRAGGSATDWTSTGSTLRDVSATNVFIQVGAIDLTAQTTNITFPKVFTQKPIVIASPQGSSGIFSAGWYTVSITVTDFSFVAQDFTKATPLMWIAIGE